MQSKKRKNLLSLLMATLLIFNVLLPSEISYAKDLNKNDIVTEEKLISLTQDGVAIGDTIDAGKRIKMNSQVALKLIDTASQTILANAGDRLVLPIHKDLKISGAPTPKEIKDGDTVVGTITYQNDGNLGAVAIIDFTIDQTNLPEDERVVSIPSLDVTAELEYAGDANALPTDITLFGKAYQLLPPTPQTRHSLTKTGQLNLKTQSITWTIDIVGKDQNDRPMSLSNTKFLDELGAELSYVPNSFKVNQNPTSIAADNGGNRVEYLFPAGTGDTVQVTFETEIADDTFFTQKESGSNVTGKNSYETTTITNNARLLNEKDAPIAQNDASVSFTPEWISKYGISHHNEIEKTSDIYTISWVIEVNKDAMSMSNAVVNDMLPDGLVFEKALIEKMENGAWTTVQEINTDPRGTYTLGNIDSMHRITIVSTIDKNRFVNQRKSFENQATLSFGEYAKPISSKDIAEAGLNALGKRPGLADENGTAHKVALKWEADGLYAYWHVSVDLKNSIQSNKLKIFDVLTFNHEILDMNNKKPLDLKSVETISLPQEILANIEDFSTQNYQAIGQQYVPSSFESPDNLLLTVSYIEKEGKKVGQVMEIYNIDPSKRQTFSYKTKIVDVSLLFPNTQETYSQNEIRNTAVLLDGNKVITHASNRHFNQNSSIYKEAIPAQKVVDLQTPEKYVNATADNKETNADHAYNYADGTVVFRLSVNASERDFDNATVWNTKSNSLMPIGTMTLTDKLPMGWSLVPFESGEKFILFAGKERAGLGLKADENQKLDAAATGVVLDEKNEEVNFSFTKGLNTSYVILLKAKPSSDTLKDYYAKKHNGGWSMEIRKDHIKESNRVELGLKAWKENGKEHGLLQYQDVHMKFELLSKKSTYEGNGSIRWEIDYKPAGADYSKGNENPKLVDKLPAGIELPVDADGELLFGNEHIRIYELLPNVAGEFESGPFVPNPKDYVKYDNASRTITFTVPEKNKNYRFIYTTDAVENVGNVTNSVRIEGDDSAPQNPISANFTVEDIHVNATLERLGALKITKVDAKDKTTLLQGAEFELRSSTQKVIRQDATDANGKLNFIYLPVGEYKLVETKAPAGYDLDTTAKKVVVVKDAGIRKIKTFVDDKELDKAELTIENVKTNSTTPLTPLQPAQPVPPSNSGGGSGGGGGSTGGTPSSPTRPDSPSTPQNPSTPQTPGGETITDNTVPQGTNQSNPSAQNKVPSNNVAESEIDNNSVPKVQAQSNSKEKTAIQKINRVPKTGIPFYYSLIKQASLVGLAFLLIMLTMDWANSKKKH
ncbi:MAG: SpaA isopeptide-forming pilin-related protein [Peptostreptococcaceae bacterium]|nr:SpaA isopeptide-forming pilin-related protein [Peptostreptococcaceae bacterium]